MDGRRVPERKEKKSRKECNKTIKENEKKQAKDDGRILYTERHRKIPRRHQLVYQTLDQ